MTQSELDALPDVTPSVGQREMHIAGRRVVVPVAGPEPGALFQTDADVIFYDASGVAWVVGWLGDRRVKRLSNSWSHIRL